MVYGNMAGSLFMKRTIILSIAFFLVGSLCAKPELKDLALEEPEADTPAAAALSYLLSASEGDLEAMIALSFGTPNTLLKDIGLESTLVTNAKNIDWSKPVLWAQKYEGESGKVAFRYFLKDSGQKSGKRMSMQKIDGVWKYSR